MITQEKLLDILNYDIKTGIITWNKEMNGAKARIGEEAGTISCGYRRIQIYNIRYMAHVLAWIYIMGNPPEKHIDHIDGNTLNNSWNNLREANEKENARNRKINSNNKSGYKGVTYHKKQDRYHARLNGNHLGSFIDLDDAIKCVENKRQIEHGEFARN